MNQSSDSARFVIVGAGVHGLSTAWHLAMELEARGAGAGRDILLLDKTGPGAGATGIACGCVRNFYMTEPIHAIVRHSIDVWTHDPINFGFQQVGYVSCGEANQADDYDRIHQSQRAVGYHSDIYAGKDAHRHLKRIWPDFKTDGIGVVLHERMSGYAGTMHLARGLAEKCVQLGVRCRFGVEVTGYDTTGDRVVAVRTSEGDIAADAVVLGLGAWMPRHWEMLGKPKLLDVRYPDGGVVTDRDMWTYWRLREGEVYAPNYRDAEGFDPPVLHVELMNTRVIDASTGAETEEPLYVYWKNAAERMPRPGVQGGMMPIELGPQAEVDPYGHASDAYQAEPTFGGAFTSALAQLMGRFEDCGGELRERRNSGIGAFTPDNVPIFDWIMPNVYMIADSGHGFKMTGVGKLVARMLASGSEVAELTPFGFGRFAAGRTFGERNSNCPWI